MSAGDVAEVSQRFGWRMRRNYDSAGSAHADQGVEGRGHLAGRLADGDDLKFVVRRQIVKIFADCEYTALAVDACRHSSWQIQAAKRLAKDLGELRLHLFR